ncbi:transposase [Streptomyces sioyaensis]|uniref:IS110 family transposase n=1 Tax=Streptomyces sioyaensis TaxID=67364 RepID=UPI0033F61AF0
MTQRPPQLWAGIDVGKGHHWVSVVDSDGESLWNCKVINSESDILTAFGEVSDLGSRPHRRSGISAPGDPGKPWSEPAVRHRLEVRSLCRRRLNLDPLWPLGF